jgi:hypothetical protein
VCVLLVVHDETRRAHRSISLGTYCTYIRIIGKESRCVTTLSRRRRITAVTSRSLTSSRGRRARGTCRHAHTCKAGLVIALHKNFKYNMKRSRSYMSRAQRADGNAVDINRSGSCGYCPLSGGYVLWLQPA